MTKMKLKKRKKNTRFRGSHTHGRGFKKKARGSGHRGGVGMAGTGKRGDAKKTLVLNLFGNNYFGKSKTLRRKVHVKPRAISIRNILDQLDSFIKQGLAKSNADSLELNLKGYKVLGSGDISKKLKIKASAASKSAIDKIKKAGGDVVLISKE